MNKSSLRFLTTFIVESDAIENIIADPKLVRSQILAGKIDGHVGALLFLKERAKSKIPLNKEALYRVQASATAEQHEKKGGEKLPREYVGHYRIVNVSVDNDECPSHFLVPPLMEDWFCGVRYWQNEISRLSVSDNIQSIADLHYGYAKIHPFFDGNGRSSRAITYYLMQFANIQPFVFTSDDKWSTYYQCFGNTEKNIRQYFKSRTVAKKGVKK